MNQITTLPTAISQLAEFNQWLTWRYEPDKDGKLTKIPKNPHTGFNASSTDPKTWGSYEQATTAKEEYGHDGIGFALCPENVLLAGIDVDDCIDENGILSELAQKIVALVDSYTEISPSGKGLRVFAFGILPEGRRKESKLDVEMYTTGRYMTITGNHLLGSPETISNRTPQLAELHEMIFGKPQPKPEPKTPGRIDNLDDQALVERIRQSEQGTKFNYLWAGDISDYPSHSEADLALVSILYFWSQGNEEQIKRLFLQSGLHREKTERDDYLDRAIAKVASNGHVRDSNYNNSKYERIRISLSQASPEPKTQWNTDELLEAEFTEPKWTIPGYVPEGEGILAGRPKMGKSWLALQMAAAVGSGGRFFDKPVPKGKVLYLALEDSPRRIKSRIKAQRWIKGTDVTFETEWPDLVAAEGLLALQSRIESDHFTFVIVDTLSRVARFKQKEMEESTEVLGLLQRLANQYGITILIIDHHRKPGLNGADDVIDSVLGSTGKTAVADCVIGLYRARGESVATLKATGRDFEEQELSIKFDSLTCSWQLLGNASEIVTNKTALDILKKIEELGEDATQANLVEHTGLAKSFVSNTLNKLRDNNNIIWEGKGKPYVLTPLGKNNLNRTW